MVEDKKYKPISEEEERIGKAVVKIGRAHV